MTQGLVQAGVEVHVATTDDNGRDRVTVGRRETVTETGVTYHYFPRQTRFYTFSWPLTQWLADHVKDYDVVHIHALFSYPAGPAAFWARRYNVPYVVRPLGVLNRWGMKNRHPWLKEISFKLIERRILAGAATIHFTSEQERLEAEELGGFENSVVIPNAVDVPHDIANSAAGRFRARYPQLADRLIVLFLSRLDPKKGLDLLLPAFARIRAQHPRAILALAGSGDPGFVAERQREAARLAINSDIFWAGLLIDEEKWAAMADGDLFVLPSCSENFGVAVVEAMASKMPVVVTDQVGIHREITAGEAGIVVPCNVPDLANALNRLIADAEMRSKMGSNGRLLAHTKYSVAATTNHLLTLYRDIANCPITFLERPAQQFN
jgi:glycosyltransferase involved in cell wall biosynthesis